MQSILSKLKQRDIALISIAITVLLAMAWYFSMYQPLTQQIADQKIVRDDLQAKVDEAIAASNALPQLRESVAKLEVQKETFLRSLPPQAQVANLVQELQSNIFASGVQLDSIAQAAGADAGLPAGVKSLTVTMALKGGFEEVYALLDSLENMQRYTTINTLSLSVAEGKTMNPELGLQLGVTVYTFDTTAAAAAAAPPAAAAPADGSTPPADGTAAPAANGGPS